MSSLGSCPILYASMLEPGMEQDLGNKILASGCTISLKAIHTNFHIFTVASLFYNQYPLCGEGLTGGWSRG